MSIDDPDDKLVRRTLGGDADAFEPLVRRHRRAALARALGILGDDAMADDVAQESFVQAYEQLATLRDGARFEAWLLTIVHRRALNALRSHRRRRQQPLDDQLRDGTPERADLDTAGGDARASLLAAMQQLSAIQRSVLVLSDLEGWAHERIAATVGCSVLMSRRHLSNARRRMRELLPPRQR